MIYRKNGVPSWSIDLKMLTATDPRKQDDPRPWVIRRAAN